MSDVLGVKKYVAELIGTFVLVFIGCGSAVIAGKLDIGFEGIAFAFGLSLLAMVYAVGGISGCHINPAVSLSMLAAGTMKVKDAAAYIVVQCVGATIASALLYLIALGDPFYMVGINGLGQNGYEVASPGGFSMVSAFTAEVVLTFIFLLVIHASLGERAPKGFAGISIGLSLVFIHLVGIPITGTSVNPARSLGPAVILAILGETTAINQLWLFWVAPVIGGLLAAFVWRFIK